MSKRRRGVSWLSLWLGILLIAAACRTDPINCDDALGCAIIRPGNPIQIATLLPTTGATAVWGEELSRGINLALSNRGGELLDHDVELIPLNSACNPQVGQEAVQTLEEETALLAIIGPACSQVAEAVLPTVQRNDWLMISPAATAPNLTENQPELAFFRTVPNHLHQATVAAYFAYDQLGVRQTGIFQDSTPFNSLLAEQFSDTFTRLGGSITYWGSLDVGQTDVASLLAEAAVGPPPELIYLALFEPEANLIVNRIAENNILNRAVLVGSDSLFSSRFAVQIGELPAEIYVTNPAVSGTAYNNFLATWANRYQTPPTSTAPAYAYDATQLLLTAIEEVAVVGQNGALVIGRDTLRHQLANFENSLGLTGVLYCTLDGECAAASYGVYELDTAVRNNAFWPPPQIWQFEQPLEEGDPQ